ncbi:hypothetical protein [Nannocystis radixulma]|uniref:Uncharacterized protein n=1 Tax=Nannocystis radixulma TaxID=2995305 RepID=A0ABT5BQM6_9BACT|nr:hypothetical protein [Nannocystis radixulma]MDC0675865.1 hypothetical protein [Nannocystis radixulma]
MTTADPCARAHPHTIVTITALLRIARFLPDRPRAWPPEKQIA